MGRQCRLRPGQHLLLGDSREHPLGALEIVREYRARRSRVPALRRVDLGVPELGLVEVLPPRPLHVTDKAIASLHRRLVAVGSEHQDLGLVRDRSGSCATRQSDFLFAASDEILLGRSHHGIGILGGLGLHRSTPAQSSKKGRGENDESLSLIHHCFTPFHHQVRKEAKKENRSESSSVANPSFCTPTNSSSTGCLSFRAADLQKEPPGSKAYPPRREGKGRLERDASAEAPDSGTLNFLDVARGRDIEPVELLQDRA